MDDRELIEQATLFFESISPDLSSESRVTDDHNLLQTDKESMERHSKEYDKLLKAYTSFVELTLKSKRRMNCAFFIVTLGVMILSIVAVGICIWLVLSNIHNESFDYQNYLLPCITALSSFLTVFIVIPKVIAEYLFNSGEETIMKEIVVSIQEYDKNIREKID